jgi:hypothetical protein
MKVNNYPVKLPAVGDRLFGSDSNGDQKQFDITNFTNAVFQYEIGEYVVDEGGVIFHRYLDGNTQKYLVIDLSDLSTSKTWSNITNVAIGSTAQSTWDGSSNSTSIVNQSGFTDGAAKLCLDSTANNKTDWYLPSYDELSLIWQSRFNVNITLSGNSESGVIPFATQVLGNTYWSSTEISSTTANAFSFSEGASPGTLQKAATTYYTRAVRKFSI